MTVLNSYEAYTNNGLIDAVVAILIVALIFLGIAVLGSALDGEIGKAVLYALIGVAVFIGFDKARDHSLEKHTEYEVIIDDYIEVFEQGYEIVEQRGEISVVKEKEEGE